jgi:tRNA (cmo5U34)-methyltransferase
MKKDNRSISRTGNGPDAFNAAHASAYAEGPPRQVPGFAGLHRMASMLLAERMPAHGRLLVLGAGGGLELKAFAEDHPDWTFDGVDPSADMLRAAEQIAAPHLVRIRLHEGYIDAAPAGPFDGAVCLLTLHFVPRDQRPDTLRHIRRRLTPGAPFIVAHLSFPQNEPERSLWIDRHLAYGGTSPDHAESARRTMAARLSILSPEEDEALLREAGFSHVSLFYAGLSFRGWVGYA